MRKIYKTEKKKVNKASTSPITNEDKIHETK